MVRKQIYLDERQEGLLKRLSRRMGVSESELIRRGIERSLAVSLTPRADLRDWVEIKTFIRRRMAGGPVSGPRKWRRDDLHDR